MNKACKNKSSQHVWHKSCNGDAPSLRHQILLILHLSTLLFQQSELRNTSSAAGIYLPVLRCIESTPETTGLTLVGEGVGLVSEVGGAQKSLQ